MHLFSPRLCWALILLTACTTRKSDDQQITDVWNEYVISLVAGDGDTLADLVDKETISYYDHLAYSIRFDDSVELKSKRYLIEQLVVLRMRASVSRDTLLKITGRELLILARDSGGVFRDAVIDHIVVKGRDAKAMVTLDSVQKLKMPVGFIKEDGQWKLRLYQLMLYSYPAIEETLRNEIRENNYDENEYLALLLLFGSKTVLDNSHWQPLMSDNWHRDTSEKVILWAPPKDTVNWLEKGKSISDSDGIDKS